MKEFNKWMKKSDLSYYWNYDAEDAAEIGWKAALEWAKTCTGKHYGPLDEAVVHIRLDLIQKELEDK